jgi:hypothetical protein
MLGLGKIQRGGESYSINLPSPCLSISFLLSIASHIGLEGKVVTNL